MITQPLIAYNRNAKHMSKSGYLRKPEPEITGNRHTTDFGGTSLILKFTTTVFLQLEFVICLSTLLNWGMGRKAAEIVVKYQADLRFKP